MSHAGLFTKPVNDYPALKANRSITFLHEFFFSSYVWCSLSLVNRKTEGQTV